MNLDGKLVRNNIPSIIMKDGQTCVTKRVFGVEKKEYLKAKLLEEVNEFIEAETDKEIKNELVDICEVLREILREYDMRYSSSVDENIEDMMTDKRSVKGSFSSGVVLLDAFDPNQFRG